MKIDLARIWASPSTLHLRVLYGDDAGRWVRSQEIHVAWTAVPDDARRTLLLALGQDHEPESADQPLW